MATKMAQLNVRMDPELKAAGDSVLDLYGVSPSELVRAVWEKIARGGTALIQVAETLTKEPTAGKPKVAKNDRDEMNFTDWVEWRFNAFAAEVDLDPSTFVPHTDEELEELLYEDYLEEEFPYEK